MKRSVGAAIAAAATIGIIVAGGGTASAATDVVSCTLYGNGWYPTPAPELLTSSSGSFVYSGLGSPGGPGSGTCVRAGDPPQLATFTASGSYNESLCGEGSFDGSADLVIGGVYAYPSIPVHASFSGNRGTLNVNGGAGVIDLEPINANPNRCADQYVANSAFVASLNRAS
jgi:hypothetical protein